MNTTQKKNVDQLVSVEFDKLWKTYVDVPIKKSEKKRTKLNKIFFGTYDFENPRSSVYSLIKLRSKLFFLLGYSFAQEVELRRMRDKTITRNRKGV